MTSARDKWRRSGISKSYPGKEERQKAEVKRLFDLWFGQIFDGGETGSKGGRSDSLLACGYSVLVSPPSVN